MIFLAATLALAPTAIQESSAGELVPLELSIVLASQDGEEAPMPFTLSILANSGTHAELRAGREVAVPVASDSDAAVRYRHVGTNLSARVSTEDGKSFRVHLSLERSSIARAETPSNGAPSFHTFSSETELLLEDGETERVVAGINPATTRPFIVELTLRRD